MFKFLRPERRASLENPSTSLANPDAWLFEAMGGQSDAVKATHRSSLGIPAYYAATGRRARTIASLSWKIYKQTDTGLEPDYEHPLYYLINRQPHPLYNSYVFFQTLVTNLDVKGVAFAYIQRNNAGVPVRLEIIDPDNVQSLQVTPSGSYYWIVKMQHPKQGLINKPIALSDMIWLKGLTFNGHDTEDPLVLHKQTFQGGLSANEFATKFYENGAHINYAVEAPYEFTATAKQNFFNNWKKVFSGLKNAFKKPLIVDAGMKLHPLKMTPADAQMAEVKRLNVEEVARIADVPSHMVGAGENFTFSSVEVMVTDFVQYSLRNTVRQIQMEFENKLLTQEERENRTHVIKANLDSLLQGDIKTRTEKLIQEVQWGLIDKNEYRKLQGYNSVENGNTVYMPVNMFVSKTGEMPENPNQAEQ